MQAQRQSFTYAVYFDLDKHELTQEAQTILDQIPEKLGLTEDYEIEILAHTDNQGGNSYNYELAQKRASAVLDYLAARRLKTSEAVLRNFGEDKPAYSNDDEEGRRGNRRVEVIVSADIVDSVDDLYALLNEEREQEYYIDPNQRTQLVADEGTMVLIPANAFVHKDGAPIVEGEVRVTLEENYSLSDMLLSRLTTVSGDKMLVSAGMINVRAYAGDEELGLNEDVSLGVGMPVKGQDGWEDGMELFLGEESSQTQAMDWRPVGQTFSRRPPELSMYTKPRFIHFYRKYQYDPPRFMMREPAPPRFKPKKPAPPQLERTTLKLNFFQRAFMSDKARERKRQALYESKLAFYRDHRLPRYENNLKAWYGYVEKYKRDSVRYIQALSAHRERVAQERLEHEKKKEVLEELAQREYEKALDKWEEVQQTKIEEYDAYIAQGNVDLIDVRRYFFSTTQLGWINCDRFWNVPQEQLQAVNIADADEAEESIYVVFKDEMTILPVQRRDGGYQSSGVPTGADIRILGIKMVDGRAQMALVETTVGAEEQYKLAYEPKSLKEVRNELMKLN